MKRLFSLSMMILIAGSISFAMGNIENGLQECLQTASAQELIPVMILMEQQADFNEVYSMVKNLAREERRQVAVDIYKNIAQASQIDLRALLAESEAVGKADRIRYLWIVNAIGAKVTPDLVTRIASSPGVDYIWLDEERPVLAVEPDVYPVNPTDDITWSVEMVNGPEVWSMGYNGDGVLVAIIDTGVNYNHVDLINRMWDGSPTYPLHGWDFYNNDNDPYDDHLYGGHGSHCAGIVAGDGTAGTQTGIAPGAEIMAVKVLNAQGNGDEFTTMVGMQFALENGADIISMSLGWVISLNPNKNAWRMTTDNLLASGMICSIAAGNEALYSWYPIPDNIRTPGCAPPPWRHPDQHEEGELSSVVTVAATTQSDVRATFSSLGPCTWENISPWFDYNYQGGALQGYVAPDIAAPGDNITSCTNTGNTSYLNMSGTSMATPQIAGIMALMLEKNPDLTPEQIDQVLELTAVPKGAPGKDTEYGSGRVDAYVAVVAVPISTPYDIEVTLTPSNPPIQIPANGGSFNFTVDLANNETGQAAFTVWIMATLPNGSDYGPIIMTTVSVPYGWSATRVRTQNVPSGAPSGNYTYHAYVGLYPDIIYDQDQFNFEKLTDFDGGYMLDDWNNWQFAGGGETLFDSEDLAVELYTLSNAYPNPFNPTTSIAFNLGEAGTVKLTVFDISGREIATLVNGYLNQGNHSVVFNAQELPSGVYFYRLEANDFTQTKKMLLMK